MNEDHPLRKRAEELLRESSDGRDLTSEELSIHKIELEMQGMELRQANEALRLLRDMYFQHFEAAPLPAIRFDARGAVVEMNLAASSMLETTRIKIGDTPKHVFERRLPELSQREFVKLLRKVLHSDGAVKIDLEISHLNKANSIYAVTALKCSSPEGPQVLAFFEDETESRRRQAELERLSILSEQTTNAVVFTDLDRRIIWVNSTFVQMTGYTLEEVRGRSAAILQGEGSDKNEVERLRNALNARQSVKAELLNFRKDGTPYWVSLNINPQRDKDGTVIGFFSIQEDITERKSAALNALKLKAGIDYAANGVVITDRRGIIEFVNPAFCHLTGYEAHEVIGKSPNILKSGEQSEQYYRDLWTAISGGHTWHGKFHNRRKDGSLYWERATISPVRNEDGATIGYIAIKENISDQLELIERLQEEQKNLLKARKEAERLAMAAETANVAKREFLANMSHEIRTPLNAIVGVAQLLSDPTDEKMLAEYIETIQQSSQSLLGLINDILDFSRIEANRLELEQSNLDLRELLKGICKSMEHSALHKALAFKLTIEDQVPRFIYSDDLRLRQIFTNLLSNAIKFTSKGGVVVRVGLNGSTHSGHVLVVEVQDTGIGIAPAAINKLFQNFSQVDASTTRRFGGSGLGLAIVKGLTALLGGTVSVHSQLGVGSTFTVELPVLVADNCSDAQARKPNQTAEHPERIKTLRLLVAEDNSTNRRIIELLLRRLGLETTFAHNGQEALDWVQQRDFDAVLMDLQMPVMDGLQATGKIRALGDRIHQPKIIALTARALAEDRENCYRVGMDGYLAKPINFSCLQETLDEIL